MTQFGNGLSLAQTWVDGRLASKRLYNSSTSADLSNLAYSYDNDDNIGAIHDLVDDSKSTYYGYDPNSRLSFASMTVGTPSSGTESYSYTSGKNRLASLTNAAGTRSMTYDGRGNTSSETRPGSASVSASYDGYGRLIGYTRTGDPAQANAYNGLDERVGVTSASTTHSFVYDPPGRLIGEYDSSGSPVAETIWLSPSVLNDSRPESEAGNEPFGGDDGITGYAPLALITGSGGGAAIFWVQANHIGVPLVTTDASGAVASPSGYTALGFPGQTRTLADLYYNRYRDYDSSLGRYIQADPIGLSGSDNPYLYAAANPLRHTDPMGLQAIPYPTGPVPKLVLRACPECVIFLLVAPLEYRGGSIIGGWCGDLILWAKGHTKGKRPSTKGKHQAGDTRRGADYRGEKGDKNRRPPRRPPEGKTPKGGWPPKS